MLDPLSIAGASLFASYTALHLAARASSAITPEGTSVRDKAGQLVEQVERSVSLFGRKARVISRIHSLAEELSTPGWDGNQADPMDPLALGKAVEFVRLLPDDLPLPDVAVDPDGSVSFDWIHSPTRVFSLSIARSSRLSYAWLDGADKGHGVSQFDGTYLSPKVLQGIRDVCDQCHSDARAA